MNVRNPPKKRGIHMNVRNPPKKRGIKNEENINQ